MISSNKNIKIAIIQKMLILVAGFLFLSVNLRAQVGKDTLTVLYPDDTTQTKALIGISTEETLDSTFLTTNNEQSRNLFVNDSKQLQKKSRDWATWKPDPKRALWLALVLPGGGQIYNRKYWKLPFIYGGFVGCVYALTWNSQMYKDYAQAYKDIMDNDDNTHSYDQFLHLGTKIDASNLTQYQTVFKKRKDKFRRWRDLSIFATIGVYALSVIDAYVDASLSDFDISDDLSLHIAPTVINDHSWATSNQPFKSSAIGISCGLTF